LHRGKNISNLPDENDSVKSLILPTLTEISSQQFDKAYMLCRSIFRNETNTNFFGENAIISPNKPTFYDHLHNLDTNDGLRLATAQMIISSGVEFEEEKMSERGAIDESTRQKIYEKRVRSGPKVTRIPTRRQHNIIRSFEDKDVKAFLNTRTGPGRSAGADIIRMGNNIRKLNELVVGNNVESEKPSDNIQVLTMDMTHWISNPFDSAIKVFDFVYGNSISSLEKRKLAIKYQESFNEKVADNSQHITTGKSYSREDKAALVEMLKGDEALGPILDEVEKLVNETMAK